MLQIQHNLDVVLSAVYDCFKFSVKLCPDLGMRKNVLG